MVELHLAYLQHRAGEAAAVPVVARFARGGVRQADAVNGENYLPGPAAVARLML